MRGGPTAEAFAQNEPSEPVFEEWVMIFQIERAGEECLNKVHGCVLWALEALPLCPRPLPAPSFWSAVFLTQLTSKAGKFKN